MSDDADSRLLIGRVEAGYVIVVTGRGTCRESAAVERFATEAVRVEHCTVTVDLSACQHLDSTFLGCLVHLHKRLGGGSPPQFVVAASPDKVRKLLAPSRLDSFLTITNRSPDIRDTLMVLSDTEVDQLEMGRHVMECHRLLAELGGPHAVAFAAVADQLEQELAEHHALPDKQRNSS
jgi:anti-anti-sigma regulatory factor